MACTIAVEEVIDDHYRRQAEALGEDEAELKATIEEFRAEEAEHAEIGRDPGGEDTVGSPVMRAAIRAGSRAALRLSERFVQGAAGRRPAPRPPPGGREWESVGG